MGRGVLLMTIPILIDGKERGTLETRREGAYTLFEARCAPLSGVRRLWVFGEEGKRGCLGVMQPAGGELRLKRRLSRAGMRDFPEKIAYAGFAEERAPVPPRKKAEDGTEGDAKPLIVTEGGERYLALPCALHGKRAGLRIREIGGRTYLLFRC